MTADSSVRFFDTQFERQVREGDFSLNPFETAALPFLHGRVLDFGCGLGNLAIAAAERGCTVVALDGSPAAVAHLQGVAARRSLPIEATRADLAAYAIQGEFDTVVSIGLLMFLDCPAAYAQLGRLRACLRPGGHAIVNVLVQGTTWTDVLDPASHCLLAPGELARQFDGWTILHAEASAFPAAGGKVKAFETVVARKPDATASPDSRGDR
jgi:tellurite methyltransferase